MAVETDTTGSTAQEEIVTLNMSCTLVDTNIPASSGLDIIVPNAPKQSENICLLLEAFGDASSASDQLLEDCKDLHIPDTASTAPISVSGNDLDGMVSVSTRSSQPTQADNLNYVNIQQKVGEIHCNAGSGSPYITEQQNRTMQHPLQLQKLQNPVEVERTLKNNAESQARYWGREFGVNNAKPPTPTSPPHKPSLTKHAQSANAWEGFAVQHGGQGGRRPRAHHYPVAVKPLQNDAAAISEVQSNTGGYCMDPYRDYTRADGGESKTKQSRQKKGTGKGRVFVTPHRVHATFIPQTQNSPAERQMSFFQDGVKYVEQRYW